MASKGESRGSQKHRETEEMVAAKRPKATQYFHSMGRRSVWNDAVYLRFRGAQEGSQVPAYTAAGSSPCTVLGWTRSDALGLWMTLAPPVTQSQRLVPMGHLLLDRDLSRVF